LREDSKVIFAPLFRELLQLSHNELGQVGCRLILAVHLSKPTKVS
jgi:hypothetical protein